MPQRGDIDYDLIRSTARQGTGPQFQMFAGSPPVNGHIAIYDVNGNVTDGGPPGATYVLPPATATLLGGVKIGANITVQADGTISVAPPGSGGQNQTPWLSDIQAANYRLHHCAGIGIGVTSVNSAGVQVYGGYGETGFNHINTSSTGFAGFRADSDYVSVQLLANGSAESVLPSTASLITIGAYPLVLGANSAEAMRIASNGNIGIAVVSPAYRLDLSGDCNITGLYRINGVPLGTGQNQTPWLSDINGAGHQLLNTSNLQIVGNSTNWVGLTIDESAVAGGHDFIIYNSGGGPAPVGSLGIYDNTSGATRFLVSPIGNIGIGSASPEELLTLDGNAVSVCVRSGGYLKLRPSDNNWDMRLQAVGDAANGTLTVQSGGALGTPIATFQHGGDVFIAGNLHMPNNANTSNWRILMPDQSHCIYSTGLGGNNMWFVEYGNWHFQNMARGAEDMTITNGNVGINDTSPPTRLFVSGNSSDAPTLSGWNGVAVFYGYSSVGVQIGSMINGPYAGWIQSMAVGNNWFPLGLNPGGGWVGVGTMAPQAPFHVNGNEILIGSSGGPNSVDAQTYMSGNWGVTQWNANLLWNGSAFVRRNSGYPGLSIAASVLNNGTADCGFGVNYIDMGNNLHQIFGAQVYGGYLYTTQAAGPGSNIDAQLSTNGQWYTWLQGPPWQFFFRVRCWDGSIHQAYMNLA